MAVLHPFQKLCCAPSASSSDQPLLFAASGPNIFTFQLQGGKCTSRWSAIEGLHNAMIKSFPNPHKRQKLDLEQNGNLSREDSEESIEIISERRKGERKKPTAEKPKTANVSHILATSDRQNLLAVTAEDKTIHVFEISGNDGVLVPQTARSMPKRICAVVLDSAEKTIIVGDKFGDVYSLPLHPSADYVPQRPSIAFKPSATELTVHTKGNLEALKQQQEQKKINPRKEGPGFEHKLLLGHVSLLTDVAIAKVQVHGKRREFILTADRDEHVRISRFPQAHIIEGYCLGHREFVSKIVIPSWTPGFMVTGGGEPSLKVYDWQKGDIICEEVFDGPVGPVIREVLDSNKGERSLDRLAVSGIWLVNVKPSGLEGAGATHEGLILIALEGMPLLLSYALDTEGKLHHHQTLRISRNVLDVAFEPGENLAVISFDSVHNAGSTKSSDPDQDPDQDPISERLVTFKLAQAEEWLWQWEAAGVAGSLHGAASELDNMPEAQVPDAVERQRPKGDYSALGEFLYGLENLRKRRGAVADDAEGNDGSGERVETHQQ